MKTKKVLWSVLTVIMLLSMTVGSALAEDGLLFRRNISKTPDQETEMAAIYMMDFYVPAQSSAGFVGPVDNYILADDAATVAYEARDYAKPLVSVYIDDFPMETKGGMAYGHFDAFAGVSLDDGTSWKTTNLSRSGDKSSFNLEDGTPSPGDVHHVVHQVAGDQIFVAWASRYCDEGTPLYKLSGDNFEDNVDYFKDLEETYGIMVYQEQILQIANVMAGFSLGEADILRRAIGKKKKKLLDKNKNRFIKQSVAKGYKKATAERVWGFIEAFANYGFNKSHAASYAMIAYQTAWLKANYPVEYMTALMSIESNSHSMNRDEKIAITIDNCRQMGIKILAPDINLSDKDFTIEKDKNSLGGLAIRFGLNAIKHVGSAAIENIISVRKKEKKFQSFTHFLQSTSNRKVNKKTIESLVKVGTMDRFANRSSMLENLEQIRQTAEQYSSEVDGQDNLFANIDKQSTKITDNFVELKEYPKPELLSFEKELLGVYLTSHPLADAMQMLNKRTSMRIGEIDPDVHQDQIFLFGGVITKFKEVTTKSGRNMAFATLEDTTGKIEFLIFPKLYQKWIGQLAEDSIILLRAKVQNRDKELKLIAEKISLPKTNLPQEVAGDYQEIFVPRKTSKETLTTLGRLLKSNLGKTKIIIIIPNGGKAEKINLPYQVDWNESLAKQVEELLK